MSKPVAYLFCALLTTLLMVPGIASAQETILELERTIDGLDNGFLIPGTTSLDVTLTVNQNSGNKAITALALEETLPAGWTFDSIVTNDAPVPNLAPAAGASGTLNFVWFLPVPTTYPYSITYRTNLPLNEEGPVDLSGQIVYRTDGPEFQNLGCNPSTDTCPPIVDTLQIEPPQETVLTLTETLSGDGLTGPNDEFYVPGQSITVDVLIEATGDKAVTALSLEQVLPAGWTFGAIQGTPTPPPNLAPAGGATGTLQFVWFLPIPTFPYNFSFTVNVPGGATGAATMTGELVYRTDGPEITSNIETFNLNEVPCLSMERSGPASYSPGGQVTLSVTLTSTCSETVTALAVEETIPAGWTFASINGTPPPNLAPAVGATGTLQFVWFLPIPTFPYTFTYTLNVPGGETGDQTISGETIYRLGGPELRTGVITTTLSGDAPPVAVCQDIIVQLGANGTVTITPAQVDGGSTDEGSIANLELDVDTFDCSNIGANTVTLTVTDNTANQSTCTANVTVEDVTPPTVTCQDIQAPLAANGSVTITAAQVVSASSDNCGNVALSLDLDTFDCNDIGANTVTVTATDDSGLTSTCTATVTVVDNIAPTAVCRNVSVNLTAGGVATITAADVNNGSSDNCGIQTVTVNPSAFDCTDIGANPVTLTVTDVNGNVDTCTATVTVNDNIDPVATCQNITRALGAAGTATITAADVDGGSTDNCSIASRTVTPSNFTCANVGANTVTLTVTDTAGNTDTCTATVTITDTTAPTASCQNITVNLNDAGTATITAAQVDGGSTDNCGIATRTISQSSFTCADLGPNTVTLTVTDEAGNTASCDATVTVADAILPTVTCQPFTVTLDANDTATITADDVITSAQDNCGSISSRDVTPDTFTCANLGDNTVTVVVTDETGNQGFCTTTVTVVDAELPVAVCTDATVELGADGTAAITAALVDGGSSDNCGIVSTSVVPSGFLCDNIGPNTVTLTVMDAAGNSDTCTATVTVVDNVDPTVSCQNITVDLDATGNATITADQIDNGSTDSCGIASVEVSQTAFTCANLANGGVNTVTLTVTDTNGNTATCDATVTVTDTLDVCGVVPCEIDTVTLLSPTGDLLVQQDAPTTVVTFASEVEVSGEEGCTTGPIEVEYFVNGVSVGSSQDAANNFPVSATLGVGQYGVVATATDLDSNNTASSTEFEFEVRFGRDANGDGYLDYPFEDLPADGDRWESTVQTPGDCPRTVVMVSWFGDVDGQDIRVQITNPADPTQTLTVIAPRELVLDDEQGVLIVSIACDLESLFAPDPIDDLTNDLPTGDLVEGTAFFEISLLVLPQGAATFEDVEDLSRGGTVDGAIEIRLDGLAFTPGLTPTFLSHPTLVGTEPANATCSECLDVVGDDGDWESDGVQFVRRSGGRLSAETTELSTFVAAEIFDKAPTLEVTPDPNFEQIIGIVEVGESASTSLTITNVGSGTVSGSVSLNGPAGVFTLDLATGQDLNYSLATGQSETFVVEFTPAAAGDFLGIVTFSGSAGGPIAVNVRGTGTVAPTGKATNILGCGSSAGGTGTVYGDLAVMLAALGVLAGMAVQRKRQHG